MSKDVNAIRQSVLDRMEKQTRAVKIAIVGAAVLEALLLLVVVLITDWTDHTHRLIVVLSMLSYMVLALGLIALGAHVSRSVGRIVVVLEGDQDR